MNGDIAEEPLAKAVLKHLAKHRPADDPMGSFARTVITGEADLRTAANFGWHSDALAAAADAAQRARQQMPPEQRAVIEEQAARLLNTPLEDHEQHGQDERGPAGDR
jgi:hypothetical protein